MYLTSSAIDVAEMLLEARASDGALCLFLGVVRKELGPEWTAIISEHSNRDGQQSMIFVRPAGRSMRMLIADYEHGELDVVRMELDGDELARFMRNPGGHHARHGEFRNRPRDRG